MPVQSVEARIDEVTIYASGARVVRVVTIEAIAERVRIANLPLAVIDDTLRVEIDGPAIATSVRADVDVPAAVVAAPEVSPALRSAERAVGRAESEVARLEGALAALAKVPIVIDPPRTLNDPPPAWGDVLSARRTVVAARGERELALRDELARVRQTLDDAQRSLAAERDREARATTAKAPKAHELRKHVDLALEARDGATGPITIRLEYLVEAARWAPSYVAKLDAAGASLQMRAAVAQSTGEDWRGVALKLSTAEPTRFAPLPELHAQRIGRRQDEPAKSGFRPPPVGAGALYADYDRSRTPHATTKPRPTSTTSLAGEVWDEQSSRAKEAFQTPPKGNIMPSPARASGPPRDGGFDDITETGMGAYPEAPDRDQVPMQQSYAMPSAAPLGKKSRSFFGGGGGGGGDMLRGAPPGGGRPAAPMAAMPHAEPMPARPVPRLDYGSLRMAGPASPMRGQLVAAGSGARPPGVDGEIAAGAARVLALPLPPGCRVEWAHSYDYAYAADGRIDLDADGTWHSLAITTVATTAKIRHVATPREQADVFRLASLGNPLAGPLLPGPIDVYDRGRFLVTSDVELTAPGGSVELGLGVDPAVKIARNTEFKEEAAGMLRGALRLHHAVTIDVENLSGKPVDIEVRERIPVVREGDDDVEVVVGRVEPSWERYTPDPDAPRDRKLRGGYCWKLAVPPAAKRTLRAAYEVKIASKLELVGGNRRDV